MYWVLLFMSSGTNLQKSQLVLKSLSVCNKVLSYQSISPPAPHLPSLSLSLSVHLPSPTSPVCLSLSVCLSVCLSNISKSRFFLFISSRVKKKKKKKKWGNAVCNTLIPLGPSTVKGTASRHGFQITPVMKNHTSECTAACSFVESVVELINGH